jgi:hypothetical protein
VQPKPGKGLRNFIRHRLLSFAMVLGVGFLLLVSLVCSAGMSALGNFLGDYVTGKEVLLKLLNFGLSLGIITVLFTMIFKFLPDVRIAWRDVWLGGRDRRLAGLNSRLNDDSIDHGVLPASRQNIVLSAALIGRGTICSIPLSD